MAHLIKLPSHRDSRGALTVIDRQLPFAVKRLYYIYEADGQVRGGHRHIKTIQAMVCVHGSCSVRTHDGQVRQEFHLTEPTQLLILQPQDWHQMLDIKDNAVILVLASHEYEASDYIHEDY